MKNLKLIHVKFLLFTAIIVLASCSEEETPKNEESASVFLTSNTLEMTSYFDFSDYQDAIAAGQTVNLTSNEEVDCSVATIEVEVTESYRIDHIRYTFNEDGSFLLERQEYAKEYDEGSTSCANGEIQIGYLEQTDVYLADTAHETSWEYDADNGILTLTGSYDLNDSPFTSTTVYKVGQSASGEITFTEEITHEDGLTADRTYTFKKKLN